VAPVTDSVRITVGTDRGECWRRAAVMATRRSAIGGSTARSGSRTLCLTASLRRFEQQGITVATTASVIAELAGDHPTYSKIMRGSNSRSNTCA
jgi:hypothetical protein